VTKKALSKSEIAAIVMKGVRWLDKHKPGWAEHIDLHTLRMENSRQCVLGQCYGDFWNALERVTGKSRRTETVEDWAVARGFMVDGNGVADGRYERLALEWAPHIAARQMQACLALRKQQKAARASMEYPV
jgi:hypothetical protein